MRSELAIVLVVAAGLLSGVAAHNLIQEESGYCGQLEDDLQSNNSVKGALACFDPASDSAEGEVSNSTELECICQQNVNGTSRTFSVRRSR